MIRRIAAFATGVLATYIVAAIVSTQMILGEVAGLGMPVSFGDRAAATLHDLAGMTMAYLPLIGASLLVAFPVAAVALRYIRLPRTLGYALAGGTAIWALHLIMIATFGMHPVPATRTALGLALQAGAGVVGGYVFARLAAGSSRTAP